MNKPSQLSPAQFGRCLNVWVRLVLALLFAGAGLLGAKPQIVSAASLPAFVRTAAPNGSTDKATCGRSYDSSTGWITPCDLQTALAIAADTNSPVTEIWIKAGTYRPSTSNRDASFVIPAGLKVFGGFAGSESARSQRLIFPNDTQPDHDNFTILSGDLQADGIATNNAYHVVRVEHAAAVTILDRLTITQGYANGSGDQENGGGLMIDNSSVYISNTKIVDNYAERNGAGLAVKNASQLTLVFSQLTYNRAGKNGGGIYTEGSDITLRNTIFFQNLSSAGDGAYAGNHGSLNVANTIFYANPGNGQAIEVKSGSSTVVVSYSIVDGGCSKFLTCSQIDTSANPGLTITAGLDGLVGTPDDVLFLPSTSPFYSIYSANLVPGDVYNIDDNPLTTDFPYDMNGGLKAPTAVTVFDFSAAPAADGMLLSWETASEINNLGFNLYRRSAGSAEYELLNPTLIETQSPGSLMGASYSFIDLTAGSRPYDYRLQALDTNGSVQTFDLPYLYSARASVDFRPRVFLPLLSVQ